MDENKKPIMIKKESIIASFNKALKSFGVTLPVLGTMNIMRIIIARELLGKDFLPYNQ